MLFLVRHGQSEANRHGLLCGRADPPLTDHGLAQAHELAVRLPRPHRIVSSPLDRALGTAAALASAGTPVEIDPRWVEMDYGALDGRCASTVDAATWRAWRGDPGHVPAGGESLVDVAVRVRAACAELLEQAADADVVVVSHVSPIKAALAWVLDVDVGVAWRMFLNDAAVCRVDTRGAVPMLVL